MAVNVAVVGLGMMGTTHFRGYQEIPEAEVVAVCDVSGRKLAGDWSEAAGNIDTGAAARQDLSSLRTYDDLAALLADDAVDLVDLCVPTFQHAVSTVRALEAGKHVMCEKPMARTSEECRRMIQAAEAADRVLAVGHVLRFWPEYVLIKEMIDSRAYGKVTSAMLTRLSPRPGWTWENWILDEARSGGAPLDLHIHDADTVQWYFGRPEAVSAVGAEEAKAMGHIVATYHWPDGPAVVAEGGWDYPASFPFRMEASLVFERAAVAFSTMTSPTLAVYEEGAEEPIHPEVPQADGYTEELRYVVQCVDRGERPERLPPTEAAAAVAIIEAEVQAARSGQAVAL
ncbi:MAG: Gfo/Idh/MocA family oxidoreductase [Planctomycetota bacterium]|nr:Gfo/Idh/MocA family oxidoreductase [Planctomycetota bacterium]